MALTLPDRELKPNQHDRARLNRLLAAAIRQQSVEDVQTLLEAGASAQGAPKDESPLLLASRYQQSETNSAIIDMIWLAGGRMQAKDAPWIDDVAAHEKDYTATVRAPEFHASAGYAYLQSLLSGEHVPTLEGLKNDFGIAFKLEKHRENVARIYPNQTITVADCVRDGNVVTAGGSKQL